MILDALKNSKLGFYLSLWSLYLRCPHGVFFDDQRKQGVSKDCSRLNALPTKRVHFWVPHNTAGAQFILWEVIPKLIQVLIDKNININITISESISNDQCDLIFSFKEPFPDHIRAGRRVLVICDEIDRLWSHLDQFNSVVCTSSFELAELIKTKVNNVYFAPEIEPKTLLEAGERKLLGDSDRLANSILWHGGEHTLEELVSLISFFARLREMISFESLEIVCGAGIRRPDLAGYPWIRLTPWSRDNLISVSKKCRLAILPARKSLKHSYLKPASRVRCSYALAVPGLGDSRVPEVVRLSRLLRMPVLDFSDENSAVRAVADLWSDSFKLKEAAKAGHDFVKNYHSIDAALSAWTQILLALFRET